MPTETKRDRPRIVILLGPTGVGKSNLSLNLAGTLGGEIVSADSMQVYQGMDIGTAKPSSEDRKRIPHHLIDVVTPDQPFHAARYQVLGRKAIDEICARKKPVWVVGGTGLYIKALTQGLFRSPRVDREVRERLKGEAQVKGNMFLFERLKEVDPETASRLHPQDIFRTIRALEVFDSTGLPISTFQKQHRFEDKPYRTLKIGLETDREALYRQIDERVDRMVKEGFLDEVKGLLAGGYGSELKPMQSLGYKQMVQVALHQLEWDEAVRQIKRDTRHYAKRQWTWFKADPEVRWRNPEADREKIISEVTAFLGKK